MGRVLRIMLLLLILILAGSGVYHRKSLNRKKEVREEALLYFKEQDYEKAARLFEEARSMKTLFSGSLDDDIASYLAESYCQLGRYDEADKIYKKLILKEPKKIEYYLLSGQCLEKAKEDEEAAAVYEQGYEKSKDPELLTSLCRLCMEDKDYEGALAYAEKGLEDEDAKQEFLFMTIIIYERAGDYDKAFQAAQSYTEAYPDDESGRKEYIFLSTRVDS